MEQFIVEPSFWEIFPEARIGVIIARGIDNTIKQAERYEPLLRSAEVAARDHLSDPVLSQNEVVAVWRDAFRRFKTKKGARSSIEALLKRVQRGDQIRPINPLVDLYNAISLTYGLPCGGEDIDAFEGDLRLGLARGGESFVTLGSDEDAPPLAGEIIYYDEAGAVCRCWNWRESVRTRLRTDTRNAFLCLELVDEKREPDLRAALEELSELISSQLGGQIRWRVLNREQPRVNLINI
ncbi:MAG TPA: B3/4 domain-containing protein [Tissierellia bacterium]|nr:B3/4 domain-containing protein [Tissierellia bacterium]